MLVQLLDPGSFALDGKPSAEVSRLSALFPVVAKGKYDWPGVPLAIHSGDVNARVPGAPATMKTYHYQTYWSPAAGAQSKALLYERRAIAGADGQAVALEITGGGAPRVLLGGHVSSVFNGDIYYSASRDELAGKRALARYIASLAGLMPTVSAEGAKQEAWARRARNGLVFIFVVNDSGSSSVRIRLSGLGALGLEAGATYRLSEGLRGTALGTFKGGDLAAAPIAVNVPQHGAAVVVVER